MNEPFPQSLDSTVANFSSVSDDNGPPVRAVGMISASRPSEEPADIAPWHTRALATLTMYSELCAARTREDFARMRTRLQLEWAFDGGVVSRFTILFFDSLLIH